MQNTFVSCRAVLKAAYGLYSNSLPACCIRTKETSKAIDLIYQDLAYVPRLPGKITNMSVFASLVVFSFSAGIWLFWPVTAVAGADTDDSKQIAIGQAVYQQNCASCHGAKLEGQPNWRVRKPDGKLPAPPHDASGHTAHHPDEKIFQVTKFGVEALAPAGYKSDMPAYEDVLSDEEIRAVIAFIKTSWPPRVRALNARMNKAYKQ